MRYGLVALVLAIACSPAASPAPSITPTATATVASTTSPFVAPSPSPIGGFAAGDLARWPSVDIYTLENDGNAHRFNGNGDVTVGRVCDEPRRAATSADGRSVLAWCGGTRPFEDMYRIAPRIERLVSGALMSWPGDVSPDARSAVAFEEGTCETNAPVCQTRAVLIDLVTGVKRELLPSNYYLGSTLGWTALGLTYFQPECAEAGCVGVGRAGTYVWNGTTFEKRSDLRFIARSGAWELWERLRGFSSQLPREVIRHGPTGDITVTPAGTDEHALSVATDGAVLAWRTSGDGGSVVRYAPDLTPQWTGRIAGAVWAVAGGDLFVTLDFATPNEQIRLYDVARRLVFATPLSGVRGVGLVIR